MFTVYYCLDLIHPDTVQKVANKQQDKLTSNVENKNLLSLYYKEPSPNPRVCILGKLATNEFTLYCQCVNLIGNSYLNINNLNHVKVIVSAKKKGLQTHNFV